MPVPLENMASKITDKFPVKKSSRPRQRDTKPPSDRDQQGSAYQSDMDILRQFDLHWEYGPCIGISRLERWERADSHKLNPPQMIKDLIAQHKDDTNYTQSVCGGK